MTHLMELNHKKQEVMYDTFYNTKPHFTARDT